MGSSGLHGHHRYGGVKEAVRNQTFGGLAAWLAFMAGLAVNGDLDDAPAFVLTGAVGATVVVVGLAAASTLRVLPARSYAERGSLVLKALAVGVGIGLVNLGANWAIATMDPALRAAMVERFARLRPLDGIVAAPMIEEVGFRLFVMSVVAWAAFRATGRERTAFVVALIGSAVIFAAPHLERPAPESSTLAAAYAAMLLAKYTALGVPLGWVFWRWGLPYSMLCHGLANATHLASPFSS